jgi:hypothetical protein
LRATGFECAQNPHSSRAHIAIVEIPQEWRVWLGARFLRRNACAEHFA